MILIKRITRPIEACSKVIVQHVSFTQGTISSYTFMSKGWNNTCTLLNALVAFQNCFGFAGSKDWKNFSFTFLILTVTWFLSFLYFVKSLDRLPHLYAAFRLRIVLIKSLFSQGRFFLVQMLTLGMHAVFHNLHELLTAYSPNIIHLLIHLTLS